MFKIDQVLTRYNCPALLVRALAGAILTPAFLAGQAHAQQRAPGGANPCAVYGTDFVAAQGTGSCVRIGGRVRLELNSGSVGHAYAPMSALPASPSGPIQALGADRGDGFGRAHMRLGGSGFPGGR